MSILQPPRNDNKQVQDTVFFSCASLFICKQIKIIILYMYIDTTKENTTLFFHSFLLHQPRLICWKHISVSVFQKKNLNYKLRFKNKHTLLPVFLLSHYPSLLHQKRRCTEGYKKEETGHKADRPPLILYALGF